MRKARGGEQVAESRWECNREGHEVVHGTIRLRQLRFEDLNDFLGLVDDEIVTANGWPLEWRKDFAKLERFAELAKSVKRRKSAAGSVVGLPGRELVVWTQSGDGGAPDRLSGSVSLQPVEGQPPYVAEAGFWIGAPFRRSGVATLALDAMVRFGFAHLGITRVIAGTTDTNVVAQQTLKSASFVHYSTGERVLPNGATVDARYFFRDSPQPRASSCKYGPAPAPPALPNVWE